MTVIRRGLYVEEVTEEGDLYAQANTVAQNSRVTAHLMLRRLARMEATADMVQEIVGAEAEGQGVPARPFQWMR